MFLITPGYNLREAHGASSFDVRHALTAAASWQLPRPLRGWTLSTIVRARSGFPLDIQNGEPALGLRFVNAGRPDLVAGVPLWISDPGLAAGRAFESRRLPRPQRFGPGLAGAQRHRRQRPGAGWI